VKTTEKILIAIIIISFVISVFIDASKKQKRDSLAVNSWPIKDHGKYITVTISIDSQGFVYGDSIPPDRMRVLMPSPEVIDTGSILICWKDYRVRLYKTNTDGLSEYHGWSMRAFRKPADCLMRFIDSCTFTHWVVDTAYGFVFTDTDVRKLNAKNDTTVIIK
jgi:hypothetical protein